MTGACPTAPVFGVTPEGEEKLALPFRGQGFFVLGTTQPRDGVIHAQQEFTASAARCVDGDEVSGDRIENGQGQPPRVQA